MLSNGSPIFVTNSKTKIEADTPIEFCREIDLDSALNWSPSVILSLLFANFLSVLTDFDLPHKIYDPRRPPTDPWTLTARGSKPTGQQFAPFQSNNISAPTKPRLNWLSQSPWTMHTIASSEWLFFRYPYILSPHWWIQNEEINLAQSFRTDLPFSVNFRNSGILHVWCIPRRYTPVSFQRPMEVHSASWSVRLYMQIIQRGLLYTVRQYLASNTPPFPWRRA